MLINLIGYKYVEAHPTGDYVLSLQLNKTVNWQLELFINIIESIYSFLSCK